ncbi:acylneuraminate cytidylyltransferase [Trichinella spiralis]|uniref:acylneuraminate cytidylyltransferase n=1 Tax=Trichinella spiralis TaxID=6334 RepID=UPI0001EFDBD4|nr:acylneuraminate cytidylyltransferase [Trichinella spiralis]
MQPLIAWIIERETDSNLLIFANLRQMHIPCNGRRRIGQREERTRSHRDKANNYCARKYDTPVEQTER